MKRIYCGLTTVTLLVSLVTSARAISMSEKNPVLIPEEMPPYTIVAFDEECNMKIVKEGEEVRLSDKHLDSNPLNEDTSGMDAENMLIDKIRAEAENYPHYEREIDLTAQPDSIVQYASDGKIHRIYKAPRDISLFTYEDALDYGDKHTYKPYKRGNREKPGVYELGFGNTITITQNHVLGEGRLSTFGELKQDEIGENGSKDPNKTGDCATRGEMDNAPYHQMIRVRNLDNDIVKNLRKNDNGRLPYAVLDIYKWDGIFFGEKWRESFTFENGRYYYEF